MLGDGNNPCTDFMGRPNLVRDREVGFAAICPIGLIVQKERTGCVQCSFREHIRYGGYKRRGFQYGESRIPPDGEVPIIKHYNYDEFALRNWPIIATGVININNVLNL